MDIIFRPRGPQNLVYGHCLSYSSSIGIFRGTQVWPISHTNTNKYPNKETRVSKMVVPWCSVMFFPQGSPRYVQISCIFGMDLCGVLLVLQANKKLQSFFSKTKTKLHQAIAFRGCSFRSINSLCLGKPTDGGKDIWDVYTEIINIVYNMISTPCDLTTKVCLKQQQKYINNG